jgi:hypothetical protein
MALSRWPLAGLRLQTPGLELRWPSPDDLGALAELAALGVHDPKVQPFLVAWTDASPDERARSTLQYHWARWGAWQPTDWTLELVVIRDGVVVGSQGVGGRDFAVLRRESSGLTLRTSGDLLYPQNNVRQNSAEPKSSNPTCPSQELRLFICQLFQPHAALAVHVPLRPG